GVVGLADLLAHLHQSLRRIEVSQQVVPFFDRQCQVITQAGGDGEIWKHPPAVLHKQTNRFLADIPTAVSYSHVGVVRNPCAKFSSAESAGPVESKRTYPGPYVSLRLSVLPVRNSPPKRRLCLPAV